MSFGTAPKKSSSPKEQTKKTTSIINYEDILDQPAGGYTIGLMGEAMSGKTASAITMGYMNKKYIKELRAAGFEYIPNALENEEIPEVTKIILIESENAFKKQRKRPFEQAIYGELTPMIKVVCIPIVQQQEIVAGEGVKVDPNSIDSIQLASDMYIAAIDDIAEKNDSHTLVIFDSASRLKWLLDTKADIVINSKIKTGGEEEIKHFTMQKWSNRNRWWQYCMSKLRGLPGWVVATFMEERRSQWIIDMMTEKGKFITDTKLEWAPKTEFNFDMIYHFVVNEDKSIKIDVMSGRYVARGETDTAKWGIVKLNKFGFLWAIEELLKQAGRKD